MRPYQKTNFNMFLKTIMGNDVQHSEARNDKNWYW